MERKVVPFRCRLVAKIPELTTLSSPLTALKSDTDDELHDQTDKTANPSLFRTVKRVMIAPESGISVTVVTQVVELVYRALHWNGIHEKTNSPTGLRNYRCSASCSHPSIGGESIVETVNIAKMNDPGHWN